MKSVFSASAESASAYNAVGDERGGLFVGLVVIVHLKIYAGLKSRYAIHREHFGACLAVGSVQEGLSLGDIRQNLRIGVCQRAARRHLLRVEAFQHGHAE